MKLPDLLAGILDNTNAPNVEIMGLTSDSRKVKSGYLFVALSEVANQFMPQAINLGAVAIISNKSENSTKVTYMQHDFPKKIYHRLATRFYKNQPMNIVAVTGTNGKTSVVNFCQQLWSSANLEAVSIGTIGVTGNVKKKYEISLTTPDAADLHYILNDLALCNINHAAVEASSHGLDQCRVHGVNLRAAAFTNLSQDHYDYHNNMESYFQTKKRLFSEILSEDGIAVLNSDIPEYQCLLSIAGKRRVISYGEKSENIKLIKQIPQNNGQTILLSINGKKYEVFLPILGKFQAYNILCAIGLVIATSVENFNLESLQAVDGRMQLVAKKGYRVVIDYAHTPDALRAALISLRWHMNSGRIILVFGCGGDRDKSKRSIVGKIANDYADFVIVCDDNPRTEGSHSIRQDIISSCAKAIEIGDRKQAIIAAINEATVGDVILIAGKGHEHGQIFDLATVPFNDFLIINDMLL